MVAQVEDAELTLLHVIEVPAALPIDAIDRSYVGEVRWQLGKLRRHAEELGAYATARVEVSHKVFDAIIDNIREGDADLLVLGWKGGWRKGRILGANVDRFVQEAPCDVVVFKSAGMKPKLDRILVLNAPEWQLNQFAFSPMQDQIARRTDIPMLMVRKVRRKEERVPLRSPLPTPAVPPAQPA